MTDPYIRYSLAQGSYPRGISSWVYPGACFTSSTFALNAYDHLWFHPNQTSSDTNSRPTGHDVHRLLIRERLVHQCFDYGTLLHLEECPQAIPEEWVNLGILALGWASTAYNIDGDMCVPHLNCREKTPTIRWRPLAFRMNGAEATPLKIF